MLMHAFAGNTNVKTKTNVNANLNVSVNANAYSPKGINTHYSNSEIRIIRAISHKKNHTRFYPRVTTAY